MDVARCHSCGLYWNQNLIFNFAEDRMNTKGTKRKAKKVVKKATVTGFKLPVGGRLAKSLATAKEGANYRGTIENFALSCLTKGIRQATA
jgi:hypothetical protein